jgi:histidine ammonia-lyase
MPSAQLIMKTAAGMGHIISRNQALAIIVCVATKMLKGKPLKAAVAECIFGSWISTKP